MEMGHPSNWGGLVLLENSDDCALRLPDASRAAATK
jgi:hypothetical protein